MKLIFSIAIILLLVQISQAQPKPNDIYVIFDASGSMWGQLPDKAYKIHVARDVLGDFVGRDFSGAQLAFRAYGHREKGDCRDSQLVASFDTPAKVADQVRPFLSEVDPLGMTPIAYSLEEALKDFDDRTGEIILITDGIETCDADPCALVQGWKDSGIEVNVHVVGFGVEAKEKAALQCIATAAGTPYREAESGMDLTLGLEAIQEAIGGSSGIPVSNHSVGLWIQGVTEEGEPIRVEGVLSGGAEDIAVSSNRRNQVPQGTYTLRAGVRTANGALYEPVFRSLTLDGRIDERVTVEVKAPPSVRATFVSEGEPVDGSYVTAFQNGQEVFGFRWMDEVFVDEGSYTFRSSPNEDNKLELVETIHTGERKELRFMMTETVRAVFMMMVAGSDVKLKGNYTLWQNGVERYKVHAFNGADILPGTYDVHLENELIPVVERQISVSADGKVILNVPVGYVTFVYEDLDGKRVSDKRVFLGRGDRRGKTVQSGQPIALTSGEYNAIGWPRDKYEKVTFEMSAGEERVIVLKATQ